MAEEELLKSEKKRLSSLPYRKLQSLAKQHSIRANTKSDEIVESLAPILCDSAGQENLDDCPKSKKPSYASAVKNKKRPPFFNKLQEQQGKEEAVPQQKEELAHLKREEDGDLSDTDTFIVAQSPRPMDKEDSVFGTPPNDVAPNTEAEEEFGSNLLATTPDSEERRRNSIWKEISRRVKESENIGIDDAIEEEPMELEEDAKTPGPSTSSGVLLRTHEKMFSKMENIGDFQERKKKRHEELTQECPQRLKDLSTPARKAKELEERKEQWKNKLSKTASAMQRSFPVKPKMDPNITLPDFAAKSPRRIDFKFGPDSPSAFKPKGQAEAPKPLATEGKSKPMDATYTKKVSAKKAAVHKNKELPPSIRVTRQAAKRLEKSVPVPKKEQGPSRSGYKPYKGPLKPFLDTREMSDEQMKRAKLMEKAEKDRESRRTQATEDRRKRRDDLVQKKRGF